MGLPLHDGLMPYRAVLLLKVPASNGALLVLNFARLRTLRPLVFFIILPFGPWPADSAHRMSSLNCRPIADSTTPNAAQPSEWRRVQCQDSRRCWTVKVHSIWRIALRSSSRMTRLEKFTSSGCQSCIGAQQLLLTSKQRLDSKIDALLCTQKTAPKCRQ